MKYHKRNKPVGMTAGLMNMLNDAWFMYLLFIFYELKKTDIKMDYLQVFDISQYKEDGVAYWKVKHSQEVPKWERIYTILKTEENIKNCNFTSLKIFSIDDGERITFMLADEY